MKSESQEWAIVLAGGAGSRLEGLTTDARGLTTPKQYCTLRGGRTLLGDALARAQRLVPRERVLVIVAAEHRRWWQDEVAELSAENLPAENVIVQPANRGTAAGLLLPALSVLERDPDARILVVPSDHFVEKEYVLEVSLRLALDSLWDVGGGVILLGIRPDVPETDYGWIVPGRSSRRVKPIEAFVEKPGRARALELMRRNGLWNSFFLVADGRSLLALFRKHAPGLLEVLQRAFEAPSSERSAALEELYAKLASVDFSRHVLEREDHLLTAEVPACGWTDLGTPARVAQCLRRLGGAAPPPVRPRARTHEHEESAFSLARALGDGAHGGEGSFAVGV